MIYKLDNGGIIKLQKAGSVPEYGNIEQIAKYNREHGTHFWKMSQVLEHDKQQAQQKIQDKKKSFWEILAGHPESSGEAILNKTIETANNTKLPETRKKIYNDAAKSELGTVAASAMTVPLLGEFTTYGLWGGLGRIAGGFGGSAVGSWGLGKAGDWADNQLGTKWIGTTGRIVGGFAGWPIGSNFAYKGALDLASKVPSIARIGATDRFIGDAAGRTLGKNVDKTTFIPTQVKYYGTQYPETTRLYRITGTSGNFTPSPDGTAEFVGQWFTDRPSKVLGYGSETFKKAKLAKVDNPIELQVVDIPNSQLERYRASNILKGRSNIEYEPTEDFLIPLDMPRGRAYMNNFTGNLLSDSKLELPNIPTKIKDHGSIIEGNKVISFTPVPQKPVSTVHFDPRVKPLSRPISEAERLGIPKGERSNPKTLEDPQYWGYQQWNDRYNAAVKAGDMVETQRLRDLHFKIKAPYTKVVDENGIPKEVYHFTNTPTLHKFDLKYKHDGQYPIYFTSDVNGRSIYDPSDAYQKSKLKVYLKMDRPLKEDLNKTKRAYDYYDLDKTMKTDPIDREEIRKFWRKKYDDLFDLGTDKNLRDSNPKEAHQLLREASDIWFNNIHNRYSREFPMKQSEIFDLSRNKNFESLLKQEFQSDGVIHNVNGTTHYITYNPESIKFSKIMTYDDNGNLIPIVKRDNFHNLDMRYKQGGILKAQNGWKALNNINWKAVPDSTFTPEKTGAGSIEYFAAEQPEGITYPNGYHKDHPSVGEDVILYNPKTNDEQDIKLDALHIMPKDATYDVLNTLYRRAAAKDGDVAFAAKKKYEEDLAKYGKDALDAAGMTPKQYFKNEADGFLRNMLIEGTPEYIKSKNYYPDKKQLAEWNKHLIKYVSEIEKYLKTGERPWYVLPESKIVADK